MALASKVTLDTTKENIQAFKKFIRAFYQKNGRKLPWRETLDPWAILVSEIMLQQTQVDRVKPKYEAFLKHFPTTTHLAAAATAQLLELWSGLGYNRRALNLKKTASILASDYAGKVPQTEEELIALPGIGNYTANAILCFAFKQKRIFIETNIRAVFINYFFASAENIHDNQLLPLIKLTLGRQDVRQWYYALMDYGAHLKKTQTNPNKKSIHYTKQSRFENSHRQIRGAILKQLTQAGHAKTHEDLCRVLPFQYERIEAALNELCAEGFISDDGYAIDIID